MRATFKEINYSQFNNKEMKKETKWNYLYDNFHAIVLGFAIAISFNVIVSMIENVVIKIAIIIHGG
jgi:hypothetical protein